MEESRGEAGESGDRDKRMERERGREKKRERMMGGEDRRRR